MVVIIHSALSFVCWSFSRHIHICTSVHLTLHSLFLFADSFIQLILLEICRVKSAFISGNRVCLYGLQVVSHCIYCICISMSLFLYLYVSYVSVNLCLYHSITLSLMWMFQCIYLSISSCLYVSIYVCW